MSIRNRGRQRIGDSSAKTTAYSLDAIGRLGGAHYERDFWGIDGASGQDSVGFQLGLGADYAINKDWSVRTGLTRYNSLPDLGTYGRTMDACNVGVSYRF